jgi:Na+/H+ antiporter NhaD/arsenite permease-like protein
MDLLFLLPIAVFVIGYILITIEHKIGTNKSAIALSLGGIMWLLVAFLGHGGDELKHHLEEAGAEIFGIVAFLLAAMALVEILIHYRFFDVIRLRLMKLKAGDKKQFIIIGFLTFFLSAVLDNLTITIVMIQIARRFFQGKNMLIAAAGIVILANAGGAWSPIGDVTTIMLWIAEKFTPWQVISGAFLPSLVLGITSGYLLLRKMDDNTPDIKEETGIKLTKGEKIVIGVTLSTFSLPLFMNLLGLQPYIGLLFGLGVVWALIEFAKLRSQTPTHLNANIDKFLQNTDIASLQFFIGILLSVSALGALGVLEKLSILIFGEHQEFTRVVIGNMLLGPLSSVVDNVPLTALAIDIIHLADPNLWVLLAIAVGTGGSFLVIGSVAGIIAMGMVKELTFDRYLKIATLPAVVGYIAAMAVWLLQFRIFS